MEEVRDQSYYPKPFKFFNVSSYDANNDPLITIFYNSLNGTNEVFKWVQTWLADGKLKSWKCYIKGEDYE